MQIGIVNRSNADKVFIAVRNISGTALSAGAAVDFDVVTVTDGNSVTASKSGAIAGLFAGITDAAMADSAYGLCQVYGYRQSAYVSAASAGLAPGNFLYAVGGILTDATMSAAVASGYTKVALFETIAASAAYSGTRKWNVFIRNM